MSPYCFCFALLACAAAVSCRLYHTVPQARKLSAWWQPRYNSSRTASLYHYLLCVCCHSICVCAVCAGLTYICVLAPHIRFSFLFCLLCLLLAAAAIPCRLYHIVSQALELSTLWQPRYKRSRTASLCGPRRCVCVMCLCKHVACATPVSDSCRNYGCLLYTSPSPRD